LLDGVGVQAQVSRNLEPSLRSTPRTAPALSRFLKNRIIRLSSTPSRHIDESNEVAVCLSEMIEIQTSIIRLADVIRPLATGI